ncbi:vacuolar protein sorting-associated protein 28 homolog 2 [Tanacetum coccineum]
MARREREMHENFYGLYGIMKVIDKLRMAYIRYIISSADYEIECVPAVHGAAAADSELTLAATVAEYV